MAYYNNYYPQMSYGYSQNQSYSQSAKTLEWVDGEVGAKAFQMPQGLPPETPIALWDNSGKRIYLKSWNMMGMPNPLQELEYEFKNKPVTSMLPTGQSGDVQYITQHDFDKFKEEIKQMLAQNEATRGAGK